MNRIPSNIILCGLPGVGKTTKGKEIAKQRGLTFIDTDTLIEAADAALSGRQRSCREIFKESGETYFRSIERQQIASLANINASVIALGGGALSDPENCAVLIKLGHLIYLKAPLDIIWQRITKGGIPPYLSEEDPKASFEKLARERISQYERYAHEILNVELG